MQGESRLAWQTKPIGQTRTKPWGRSRLYKRLKHVLFTDTAVSLFISSLRNVASADPAEMMQIDSLDQIEVNRRPSKYTQIPHDSTGGLARRAFTDEITVLRESSCLHHSSKGRLNASFLQDASCPWECVGTEQEVTQEEQE